MFQNCVNEFEPPGCSNTCESHGFTAFDVVPRRQTQTHRGRVGTPWHSKLKKVYYTGYLKNVLYYTLLEF